VPYAPTLPERPSYQEVHEALVGSGQYLLELRARRNAGAPVDESFRADWQSAVEFMTDWDPIHKAFEYEARGLARAVTPVEGTPTVATTTTGPEIRTAGTMLIESESYQNLVREGRAGTHSEAIEFDGSFFMDGRADRYPEVRTLITGGSGAVVGNGGLFTPVGQPTDLPIRIRQRRMFVRDLFTVLPTTLPAVPYIREFNAAALEGSASAVAEGSAKPEVDMQWENDTALIKKIAAWVPLTTEVIDDAPLVRGYVDTRLGYMLAIREEDQLLNGSGSGANLKGLLSFSGVQTQSAVTDVPQTLAAAIAKVENVDGEADGVVMNTVKYWTAIATRYSTQFDGGMADRGLPYTDPSSYGWWGMDTVRTRAMASTKALVGSFKLGATMLDRMRSTIFVGNQHANFLIENKVAVVAEERIGLAVHRPDFFVDVTLP
jgi:HK97 family phage major capsid protein